MFFDQYIDLRNKYPDLENESRCYQIMSVF